MFALEGKIMVCNRKIMILLVSVNKPIVIAADELNLLFHPQSPAGRPKEVLWRGSIVTLAYSRVSSLKMR